MEYREDRISRTAGEVYHKADWETWLLYPRAREPYTFCNIFNYSISHEQVLSDGDLMQCDMRRIIDEIEKMNFFDEKDSQQIKVKKK